MKPAARRTVRQRLRELGQFLQDVYEEWGKDHPELLAAGMGYFMLFSLPPLIIIGSAALGYVFTEVNPQIMIQKLAPLIGTEAAESILKWMKIASEEGKGKATILSLAILWLGAARVFTELRTALNWVWKVDQPRRTLWGQLLQATLRKVGVVFGVGVFIVLVFITDTVLAFLSKSMGAYFPFLGNIYLWQGASFLVSLLLLTVGVAAIYRYVPDTRIQWQDVWPGAAITAVLLSIGKTVLSFYLGFQSFSSAYGAAGSIIVIMIWIYMAAQIFFFGAKLTWLYARQYGSGAKGAAKKPA